MLVCARAGKYTSTIPTEVNTLPTQKHECLARITVGIKDNKWYIMSVHEEHSHDMSPTKSRLFRGNRRISLHAKRVVDINNDAGVRINNTFRSFVSAASGYENMEFVERDVRNYVSKSRRALGKEGDGKALLNHFYHMRELNPQFYFDIDLDDDNRIRHVFWADARSRAAWDSFGDVLCFDTTYLTNKYDMPFAPFVGVNHHGQSILLGCGLLSSEDTEAFVWLFQSWLRCMSHKPPQGIVTDQCRAMKNAVEVVFPNARHRWCLWHIMKKIPEKLQGYTQYKDMKRVLKSVVYELTNVDVFMSSWGNFISEYDLCNNDWLNTLFEERARWVPCYLKGFFWAGMSTTQRSESMNAFFDGYINSMTCLQQFVHQYDNALQHKAELECEADFASLNKVIPCSSQSAIERQFQAEYTHAKFNEVQAEFRGKMNCAVNNFFVDGHTCRFNVMEESLRDGRTNHSNWVVLFDRENLDVCCTCLLFEFRGILCRHCLVVLGQEKVIKVPTKYILTRWSKNVRRKNTYIRASYGSKDKDPQVQRYDGLCKKFYDIAESASGTTDTTELLHKHLDDFVVIHVQPTHPNWTTKKNVGQPSGRDVNEQPMSPIRTSLNNPVNEVRSPIIVKRKGRPRSTRKKSCSEKGGKQKKSSVPCQIPIDRTTVSEMHNIFDLELNFHFL